MTPEQKSREGIEELLQIYLSMRSSDPAMDDFDGLNICENCGDAYTRGVLCRSCAEQRMIDES